MEHPSIDIRQIKEDLTIEEIQAKIIELRNRLSFAYSTGNQNLLNQIEMVLEVYTRAQFEVLDDMFKDDDGEDTLGDKINIT